MGHEVVVTGAGGRGFWGGSALRLHFLCGLNHVFLLHFRGEELTGQLARNGCLKSLPLRQFI